MKFLLDTCTISDAARGDAATLEQLRATTPGAVAVSVVSVMEIEYGLALHAERARKVAPFVRAMLAAASIIDFGVADASATASVRAALARKGKPVGAYDLLIAGTALARGLTLVSANEREFRRISGLTVQNWRGRATDRP
jgi:tRNA(fMet)-specific endonuclease VapC